MSLRTHEPNDVISALLAFLPPSEQLTTRTKEALTSLGAALVFDLYEMVRGASTASKPPAPQSDKKPNFLCDPWSEQEEHLLRKNIHLMSFGKLAALIGRSENAVGQKAKKLGLVKRGPARKWTAEDHKYLKEHYRTESVAEIARHLGRTIAGVSNQAYKLNLARCGSDLPISGGSWTPAEREYVEEHQNDDDAEVAAALGRSMGAVRRMRALLGIPRRRGHVGKSERNAAINALREKGLSRAQIVERLGVSPSIVSNASRSSATGTPKSNGISS